MTCCKTTTQSWRVDESARVDDGCWPEWQRDELGAERVLRVIGKDNDKDDDVDDVDDDGDDNEI